MTPTVPRAAVALVPAGGPTVPATPPEHHAVPVAVAPPSPGGSPQGGQCPRSPWWPCPCAHPVPAVVFGEHSLLVTVSGQKLFVVKRQNHPPEPIAV